MPVSIVLYHNSHESFFRNPFGALPCGQKVKLRLLVQSGTTITCLLRLWEKDREVLLPMKKREEKNKWDGEVFEVEYTVPNEPGLIWYYFMISTDSQLIYYGDYSQLGGEGKVFYSEPPGYQITVYQPMTLPSWYKKGIIYQIYVDRFFNGNEDGKINNPHPKALIHSNWYDTPFYIKNSQGEVVRWNFFGGNLQGVLKKLPYLKELGVSIIYFNPIFESPSNHKYDTGDYLSIDPMYGDMETFERLVQEGKKLGISIILDGVFSHTGDDSIYFNRYGNYPSLGASQSPDSPYYSWYKWQENGQVSYWWGVKNLPEVNEMDPSYLDFVIHSPQGVLKTWMKKGIKGWRLDVADELPDEFIQEFYRVMKELDEEAVLIGEVWEDASRKKSYGKLRQYLWGNELNGTMNYPLREILLNFFLGKADAWQVHRGIMSLYENYPRENFFGAMNLIGSHDRARILTILGEAPPRENLNPQEQENFRLGKEEKELAVKRLKMLTLIQMTFPGVPSIYYGDEAGLEGYEDPYNRGTYPWGREDQTILAWMKRVLYYRREYQVLTEGDFFSWPIDRHVYGVKRSNGQEEILLLVNNSTREYEMQIPFVSKKGEIRLEDGRKLVDSTELKDEINLIIDIFEGRILYKGIEKKSNSSTISIFLEPLSTKALYCSKISLESYFPSQLITRTCGILMAISSLPSKWGVGDLGQEGYSFVDFLAEGGQRVWQVLPLNPLGLGDSPYQSESAFAGDPLYIDLDFFVARGLLRSEKIMEVMEDFAIKRGEASEEVSKEKLQKTSEYEKIRDRKLKLLREAYENFLLAKEDYFCEGLTSDEHSYDGYSNEGFSNANYSMEGDLAYLGKASYERFLAENEYWLQDYALYLILKERFGQLPWQKWDDEYRFREPHALEKLRNYAKEEIDFIFFTQYTFHYQWQSLKSYANQKNISLMGDMPIFVAADSCDTWANPDIFVLNEDLKPRYVAGVPPDYFSSQGQNWGSPVYNWDRLAEDNYSWWKKRFRQALERYDAIRLDHFRGFQAYWAIPSEKNTGVGGRWFKGPGKAFFEAICEELGPLPIIAEDLGTITPEVEVLRKIFGFPGMKIFQFSPIEEIEEKNTIFYTGTHDNDTFLGYYLAQGYNRTKGEYMVKKAIEDIYHSKANWVILPLQDVLKLDSRGRMNTPGTIAGNWKWRVEKSALTREVCQELRELARQTRRLS
ncbi:MAG: bifunctional glycogen debranching protein GlgX/4-alpha-glucanotransferase [Desulfitobacterium sp.]|nr:bifunctional glycogen debranching protein GlgX/4-alpha-glucanotransferase [Desulfitobacterium sp.]